MQNVSAHIIFDITKRQTGPENGMENGMENGIENENVVSNPFEFNAIFLLFIKIYFVSFTFCWESSTMSSHSRQIKYICHYC